MSESKEEKDQKDCCTCCPTLPCCNCCSSEATLDKETGPTPLQDRSCTDVLFLVLFGAFWLGMLLITGIALNTGDPSSIEYGADYMGNRCGQPGTSHENSPYTFYPRIGADVMSQLSVLSTTPWKLKLYGLCLDSCKQPGDAPVRDYGCDEGNSACVASSADDYSWTPVIPTFSLLHRCTPINNENVTVVSTCSDPTCSEMGESSGVTCFDEMFPEKDLWLLTSDTIDQCRQEFKITLETAIKAPGADSVVESLASFVGGLNTVILAIREGTGVILLFGLVGSIILGFLWIAFLRQCAKPAVYFALFLCVFTMVFVTCGCAYKAGMAPDFVYEYAEDIAEDLESTAQAEAEASGAAVAIDNSNNLNSALAASEDNALLWKIGTYVLVALTITLVFILVMLRKQIAICVAIVVEASKVVAEIPTMMFFPMLTIVMQFLLVLYILAILLYVCTTNAESFDMLVDSVGEMANDTAEEYDSGYAASIADTAADTSWEEVQTFMGCYWIFGYLWTNNLLLATSYTVTACTTAYWFFFRNDEEFKQKYPLVTSFSTILRKHMGTMAFGSLLVAIVQAIRLVLAYIDQQTKDLQKSNPLVGLVMKCVACCLWCFEKSVKFVTSYCYLYTAINGDSFCSSCKLTFQLIAKNPGQVAINTMVNKVLYICQSFGIPLLCALSAYNFVNNAGEDGAQSIGLVTLILSYTVIRAFGGVYESIVDCLFVSAFRDMDQYESAHLKDCPQLKEAMNPP